VKIRQLILHNFRSIKDATFRLSDYSLLVGENNAGKTAVVTALRIFYEDEGAKYSREVDFPKFATDDHESWIEIHFDTTIDEQESLKKEYRSPDNILRVRRYFESENENLVKTGQSNIYGYENGGLSENLFYGAKNISQAKLGKVVHIPEVSRADDTLKVSGPSPFREMVNFVMKRAVQESATFSGLQTAFDKFNVEFKEEASKEGFSIKNLERQINEALSSWKIRFGTEINQIRPEDIVRNLLDHYIEDLNLNSQRVKVGSFGQGLQRHLIYTLIRLSSKFKEQRSSKKKEFAPEFTLILFEEPEAFLHPSQQQILDTSLHLLSKEEGQQILLTSHSPLFVSRNVDDLTSICRLNKSGPISCCFQICEHDKEEILDDNLGLYRRFCDMLQDPTVPEDLKRTIRNRGLGEDCPDDLPGYGYKPYRTVLNKSFPVEP
jgi:putative ATP-dependent endonuclease of OLD family